MAQAKKRRKFFDVEIPLVGKVTQLQAYALEELNGKFIKYDLTRMLRGKSVLLQAKIAIEGEKAIASPRKVTLLPYFIKRVVRKGTNYVEDSFFVKTKDSQLQIKPFLVTRRKVSRAVRKALRNKAREEIENYAKEKSAEEIFDEVLKNQLQKNLSGKLKKIYPLSSCEISCLKIKSEK